METRSTSSRPSPPNGEMWGISWTLTPLEPHWTGSRQTRRGWSHVVGPCSSTGWRGMGHSQSPGPLFWRFSETLTSSTWQHNWRELYRHPPTLPDSIPSFISSNIHLLLPQSLYSHSSPATADSRPPPLLVSECSFPTAWFLRYQLHFHHLICPLLFRVSKVG